MRTIGVTIKEVRSRKKWSKTKLAKRTKIKTEYIAAIESERWEDLPEYPIVRGFVKNIASSLDMNQSEVVAILRRDFPPKSLRVNPKPDVTDKSLWNPRLTFFTGVMIVAFVVAGYLSFQYYRFVSPPSLEVNSPSEGEFVEELVLNVSGVTHPEATVSINNQPVIVSEDGSFSVDVKILEETSEIIIIAKSRSGKETTIHRTIYHSVD
jgi:cytoskeletal protein RodZ